MICSRGGAPKTALTPGYYLSRLRREDPHHYIAMCVLGSLQSDWPEPTSRGGAPKTALTPGYYLSRLRREEHPVAIPTESGRSPPYPSPKREGKEESGPARYRRRF